ncbi:MAG TPA: DUF4043 family protein [Gammaproteobacteria bacterium]|mgnify:CR=1 FL=1|nr:DUF4043 family protein [Gammaproteobacteria bacterium]
MATAVVSSSSALKRKKWMREGLIQASSKSFWSPYTGMSMESLIFQVNNESPSDGNNVTFDFDGNLVGKAIKGKNTAFGNGEQKRKFSTSVSVDRYRLVTDNGDKFDAVDIGDLNITQHTDSRMKLGDLFVRFKDQAIFDTAQGYKDGVVPTHTIQLNASTNALTYTNLVTVEKSLRTGTGYMTGAFGSGTAASQRAPLKPYRLEDGRSIWLLVVDPFTAANIKGNTAAGGIMSIAQSADLRGSGNRVFRGILGKIGQLILVEAEAFFGTSTSNGLEGTEVEISGMRQYDATNSAWSGESSYASAEYSRNLIMGEGAIQLAFGKQPDYKFQESNDFGIKSESAVEFWMNSQKTNLTAENSDYSKAKRAALDYGVIAFDVKL